MKRLQKRLRSDEGFTLIELLVVMIIIGILIAIAVPSYLAFQGTAQNTKAEADVRAAVPDAEEYFAQNNTYATMTDALLKTLDPGIGSDVHVYAAGTTATGFCLYAASAQAGTSYYYSGPGGGTAGGVTKTKADNCTGAP